MSEYLIQSGTLESIANAIRAKKGTSNAMTPAQMADEIAGITTVENVEWHQDVEAVRNYIANVNYADVPYTESSITTYAPNPPVISNTKPIGKTVGGKTYYNNIPNAKTPFAGTGVAGTLNPLDQVRWINSQTTNMRDLGGWACDGGTVRYGMLFRSGNLVAADEDLVINQLGIHTELDLSDDGTPAYGDRMRFVEGVGVYYNINATEAWRVNLRGIFDSVRYGEPAIFHCAMGADRTGTLACVLEGLLGVSQSDIDKDYELTSFYSIRARNGNYQGGGTTDWAHLISAILALSGNTFRDKCVSFALSVGITIDEINAYRAAMIDGTPETLSPTVETVTVTKSLTDCTMDNATDTVNKYQPYEAVITPNDGYALSDVSITMGGTNVTANAYREEVYPENRGIISIERVTGAISISATAEKAEIPNLFDASDPDVVLRGRINSAGQAVDYADGQLVTGYISAAVGDTFFVETDKSLKTNGYTGAAACYTSGKARIGTMSNGSTTVWTFTNSDMIGRLTIPQTLSGDDYSGTAYVRFCVAYTDIDNIKIYKQ